MPATVATAIGSRSALTALHLSGRHLREIPRLACAPQLVNFSQTGSVFDESRGSWRALCGAATSTCALPGAAVHHICFVAVTSLLMLMLAWFGPGILGSRLLFGIDCDHSSGCRSRVLGYLPLTLSHLWYSYITAGDVEGVLGKLLAAAAADGSAPVERTLFVYLRPSGRHATWEDVMQRLTAFGRGIRVCHEPERGLQPMDILCRSKFGF